MFLVVQLRHDAYTHLRFCAERPVSGGGQASPLLRAACSVLHVPVFRPESEAAMGTTLIDGIDVCRACVGYIRRATRMMMYIWYRVQ